MYARCNVVFLVTDDDQECLKDHNIKRITSSIDVVSDVALAY